jgi:hypothetical protein
MGQIGASSLIRLEASNLIRFCPPSLSLCMFNILAGCKLKTVKASQTATSVLQLINCRLISMVVRQF